jgi:hypothetical protein
VKARSRGAFVLGAPGTYVVEGPDRLVVGHRPGRLHAAVAALFLALGVACCWLLWPYVPGLGAVFLLLSGGAPLLALLNTQRWEVQRGVLRAAGRALGVRRERAWPLPPDSAVRVDSWTEADGDHPVRWPCYQAQVRTADGWVGVAEAAQAEPVRAFARRLAAAAGVPLEDEVSAATPPGSAPPPAPRRRPP